MQNNNYIENLGAYLGPNSGYQMTHVSHKDGCSHGPHFKPTLAPLTNHSGRRTWSPYGLPRLNPNACLSLTKVWPAQTCWLRCKRLFVLNLCGAQRHCYLYLYLFNQRNDLSLYLYLDGRPEGGVA